MTFTCIDNTVMITFVPTPTYIFSPCTIDSIHSITLHTIINMMTTTWVIHTLGNPNRKVGATVPEHGKKTAMALLGKGESRVLIETLP